MFLTDGGTERPEELFEQYNPNKTVCTGFMLYADYTVLYVEGHPLLEMSYYCNYHKANGQPVLFVSITRSV